MEFPSGLGGITLVAAALIWLIAFVPGYARKSQIEETAKFVKQQQRESDKSKPLTKDDQLSRLLNTQRWFSILFALSLIGAVALGVFAAGSVTMITLASLSAAVSVLSLLVSRAAAKAASRVATNLHNNRLQVRSKAQKSMSRAASREWTPNPLPAPLATQAKLEPVPAPIAEVISIDKPRRSLTGSEIDQILARRRAI